MSLTADGSYTATVARETLGDEGLSSLEKLAYLTLSFLSDENGVCSPSLAELMQIMNMAKSTLCRLLNSLEAKGYLMRRKQTDLYNGASSTQYIISFERQKAGCIAVGQGAQNEAGCIAVGQGAQNEAGCIAVGQGARNEAGCIAVGQGAQNEAGCIAVGQGSDANESIEERIIRYTAEYNEKHKVALARWEREHNGEKEIRGN